MNRRAFLALAPALGVRAADKKILVGGHCWVYAAPKPRYDPTDALGTVMLDSSAYEAQRFTSGARGGDKEALRLPPATTT